MSWQRSVWTFRQVLAVIVAGGGGQAGRLPGRSGPLEQAGERRDGLEQQRVESGLLVGGALGVEAGDEPVPLGLGLVLVLGGLPGQPGSLPATSAALRRE